MNRARRSPSSELRLRPVRSSTENRVDRSSVACGDPGTRVMLTAGHDAVAAYPDAVDRGGTRHEQPAVEQCVAAPSAERRMIGRERNNVRRRAFDETRVLPARHTQRARTAGDRALE